MKIETYKEKMFAEIDAWAKGAKQAVKALAELARLLVEAWLTSRPQNNGPIMVEPVTKIEDRACYMFQDFEAWQDHPTEGDEELQEVFARHLRAQAEDAARIAEGEALRLAGIRAACAPYSDEAIRMTACMVTTGVIAREIRAQANPGPFASYDSTSAGEMCGRVGCGHDIAFHGLFNGCQVSECECEQFYRKPDPQAGAVISSQNEPKCKE